MKSEVWVANLAIEETGFIIKESFLYNIPVVDINKMVF